MTYIFWDRLASTPWWMYALFIYCICMGMRATKANTVKMKSIFIFPAIFLFMSFISLSFIIRFNFTITVLWSIAMLIGMLLGWLHFRIKNVKAVKNQDALYIPGTWSVLIFVILAFCWKMYSGYQLAFIDLHTISQEPYASRLLALYGLMTGLFIGRLIYSIRCLKFGPWLMDSTT